MGIPSSAPVPPPPAGTAFEIRTMKSDSESIKQTGGVAPAAQAFSPASIGVGEKAFTPGSAAPKKKGKTVERIIVAVVVIAALGALGVIGYRLTQNLFVTPIIEPVATPEPEITPPAPPEETQTEETTPALIHASFFTLAADKMETPALQSLSLSEIKSVIPPSEEEVPTDGSIREIVMSADNASVVLPEFLGFLTPDIDRTKVEEVFESDFTFFVYRDKTMDLPGFIAKVKAGTPAASLSEFSTLIEDSSDLINFYPTDPGTISSFKDGSLNGETVKYASFSKSGYAFDYGWFTSADEETYLVVSTSYAGMKEAVKRAGF